MFVLTHSLTHLLVGCLNECLNDAAPVVTYSSHKLGLIAIGTYLIFLLCLLLYVLVYCLCLVILSLAGKLLLFVGLAHVYGPLLALHQWVLTTDDQPGLAGAHGAGQKL